MILQELINESINNIGKNDILAKNQIRLYSTLVNIGATKTDDINDYLKKYMEEALIFLQNLQSRTIKIN